MRNLLKLEEVSMFLLALLAYSVLDRPWWLFALLLLTPDLGMIGYLGSPRLGAITYNLTHHKGVVIALWIFSIYSYLEIAALAGIIIFAHSSVDRVLGYGLKHSDSFQNTHLGPIGQAARRA